MRFYKNLCISATILQLVYTPSVFKYVDFPQLFYIFPYVEKQITWTIAAIGEFAKAKELSVRQAFNYLSLFKGIDFLQTHYGAEHLLSFDDTIDDLTAICQRNGGQIL